MNRSFAYILLILLPFAGYSQVSISKDNSPPDPSAMLDVKSNSQGILLPRVALTSTNSPAPVVSPAVGLMVYNTAINGTPPHNVSEGYYRWDGSGWVPVSSVKGVNVGDMQYWNGVQWVNVSIGQPGQYLQISGNGIPGWSGAGFPVIITLPVTSITSTSAVSGGSITSDGGAAITSRGICWNTAENPTISDNITVNGTGTGTYSASIASLTPGTIFHVRAYATNSIGTNYGADLSFTTLTIPSVTTEQITAITQTTAQSGGNVTADGGAPVTSRGVCWSQTPDPTIADNTTSNGTGIGSFVSSSSSLATNTIYYLRAYATNIAGTSYGNSMIFSTLPPAVLPTVSSSPVTSITQNSANSGGNITSDGYSPVIARGVCWSLLQNPTTSDTKTSDGTGTGSYTSILAGLIPDTIYYMRAYGTNSVGTAYGLQLNFRTLSAAVPHCPGLPSITYEGKTYNTVLIGSQCWLKENLNAGTRIDGTGNQTDNDTIEKYCLNNLESNCSIYGGLYQWNELMAYVPIKSGQGICPQGWHIPAVDEVNTMISYLGGSTIAGGKLKETGTSHWIAPNTAANNLSGFTGMPGSQRASDGSLPSPGSELNIWISGNQGSGFYKMLLHYNSAMADIMSNANNDMGFSVRCMKDTCSSYSSSGVVISPVVNPACAGTIVNFTAIPTNGGSTPFYQWKVNNVKTGTNNAVYSYSPANNDIVTCLLYSSNACVANPAFASPVNMSVTPNLPVSIVIAASVNPVCSGYTVTFSATPVNGGSAPVYQWKVNGSNITGATNATYSYAPSNGNIISCLLTSSINCSSGSPAISNAIAMTVNPLSTVSVSISVSSNPVCSGSSATFAATPTNGGSTPAYQWRINGTTISGATNATYSFVPANNNAVTCVLNSNVTCPGGNPATSNTVVMTVNPLLPVSLSITASANPVCAGSSVTFTASPVNGGTSPTYQWRLGGTNISGATNAIFTTTPANNSAYTCVITSSEVCKTSSPATSNTITMTLSSPAPVSVSISASTNPVCSGTTVTYTATPTNGGTSPVYQWKVNGTNISGATNTTFSNTPVNGQTISCILTSNLTCISGNPATSNTITMTVNPLLPVSVGIVASANPVCNGTTVTFTATPTNGGTLPVYQWKLNGNAVAGATNATHTYTPQNGNVITCVLTSGLTCTSGNPATSNSVTMTVTPLSPVSVSVAASANPSCSGSAVTYTATPTNGGASPSYQWRLFGSNISGATNATYSYIPLNGNPVSCVMTSSLTCKTGSPATSNTITMGVNTLTPVSVTIAASANPVCAGILVTYTATPVYGGTSPAYLWKVNNVIVSGATNATYSFTPSNGNTVACVMTSSITCPSGNPATSNTITMTVNPLLPVSVSISASSYAVVAGTSVTFTATTVNGGSAPVYQWRKNGINVGTSSNIYTYIPANNDSITCVLTSNITPCTNNNPATSNMINMIVYTTGTACTSAATVYYAGMTYNTVQVGTQCWLRENLNIGTKVLSTVTQTNNGIIEKYCYNNDDANCNVYGGLYQWAEMVQYLNGVTNSTHWDPLPSGNVQGLCPQGWHIPTMPEATTLITFLGGNSVAGGKLKETGLVHWGPLSNVGASNSTGFTALPGGYSLDGAFGNINHYCNFWTITKGALASAAKYFGATFSSAYIISGESSKIVGDQVRCLKD